MSDEARFWSKVDKRGPDDCWPWLAHRSPTGYGVIGWKRKVRRAHRISYEMAYGEFDSALSVCHKCDNPSCVNPRHLFLGTHADNMRDAAIKGRLNIAPAVEASRTKNKRKGERHHASKMTAESVLQLREMRASGEKVEDLARRFGLTIGTVTQIYSGTTWRHVGGPLTQPKFKRHSSVRAGG